MRRACIGATIAALAAGVVAAGAPGTLAKATKPKVVKVCDDIYTKKPCADQVPIGTVRVRKGGVVKWDWTPTFNEHNVTLKRGPKGVRKRSFRSQTTNDPSFFFRKRFKKVGRYRFYCTIHPDVMRMTVRVHR